MSLEKLGPQISQAVHDKSMQGIEWVAGTRPAKFSLRKTSDYLLEQGMDLYNYKGLEESISESRNYLLNGYHLVLLSSHKSHAGEMPAAAHIMGKFMDRNPDLLESFSFPYAASMESGQQGKLIKLLHDEAMIPTLTPRKINPFPVVTDNDVKKRGMQKRPMKDGMAIMKSLKNPKNGLFAFIEGSIEGGRRNPMIGEINGLQMYDSFLENILEISKRREIPMVFVMAGISRSHTLFSAEGKFVTPEWIKAMAEKKVRPHKTYAEASLSSPVPIDHLNLENIPQAAKNLMIILSSCLPFEERGKWKGHEYLLNS